MKRVLLSLVAAIGLLSFVVGCGGGDGGGSSGPATVDEAAALVAGGQGVSQAAAYAGPGPHKIAESGGSVWTGSSDETFEFDADWIPAGVSELQLVVIATSPRYIDTGRTWVGSGGQTYRLMRTEIDVTLRDAQTASVVASTTLVYDGNPIIANVGDGNAWWNISWNAFEDWLAPYVENAL